MMMASTTRAFRCGFTHSRLKLPLRHTSTHRIHHILGGNCPHHGLEQQRATSSGSRRWMSSSQKPEPPSGQLQDKKRKTKKKSKKKSHNNNPQQSSSSRSLGSSKLQQAQTDIQDIDIDNEMEEQTRAWVKRVVVGMNLCPFAAKPLADHQLYISVVPESSDIDTVLQHVLAQSLAFLTDDTKEDPIPGTALLVCPDLFPTDFDSFLDVLSMIVDGLLEDHDLTGKIQIVPFHPLFVFANENIQDKSEDDPDKMEYYTNRSPYPMFHVLKEDDVSRAVEIMKGDTDRVWQRNIHLLQSMGKKCREQEGEQSSSTQQTTTTTQVLLQNYLQTGADDEKKSMTALAQQALEDTAKEFPLLSKPINNSTETS
ncbi:expressed unknown protein [Seminavis robusta]|uniref:DUF1415 domain-containing protein n=1 Tax=Seminavis robusta TaxID=568900 RepID=A0A9N8HBU1_9STRA|nr:expressed unknown protein [Seminavis robusta]|eukprot:Sro292_g109660.2  (369) ;mRNA; r:55732-56838